MSAMPQENKIESPDLSRDLVLDALLFNTTDFNHTQFLHKKGLSLLKQGDVEGIRFLDQAANLSPEDSSLLTEQASALIQLASAKGSKRYYQLATKKLKSALKIEPKSLKTLRLLGHIDFVIGKGYDDFNAIMQARKFYLEAISLVKQPTDQPTSELYWEAASVYYEIAKHSGEVSDLKIAIDYMTCASNSNDQLPVDFWLLFGTIYLRIGKQLNDIRFYFKALSCHKSAVQLALSSFSAWLHLGITLSELYTLSHEEDVFTQANDCFSTSAELQPRDYRVWELWAILLKESGIFTQDKKRLFAALEKCQRALRLKKRNVKILVVWSEVLSTLAVLTERIELLHEAQNKAQEAFDLVGMRIETSYANGVVLYHFAKFYEDVDYYYQAIEQFQSGVSLNRCAHELWAYLGRSFKEAFYLDHDEDSIAKAQRFFEKAIDLVPSVQYYYEYAETLLICADLKRDRHLLERSIQLFEYAIQNQRGTIYASVHWLFRYAIALDLLGDIAEDETFYLKAIEVLGKVLLLDPDFAKIHLRLATVYTHLGELTHASEAYERALLHFKIAANHDKEDCTILLEWGLCLINHAESCNLEVLREQLYKEAEFKLCQAGKLGNTTSFYNLSCLYALMYQYDKAFFFLEKANYHDALPPLEDMLNDSWLENLHGTEAFADFVHKVESRASIDEL